MKKSNLFIFIVVCFIFIPQLGLANNDKAKIILNEGIEYFKSNQFELAALRFRDVTQNNQYKEYHGFAYFMLAKSYMALRNYTGASKNLEFFLINYPDHTYYSEAIYLKGKLIYYQGDFEGAISVLKDFINTYKNSPFVPNSYFFIGECLFNLGHFDEAETFYGYVLQKYPTSYKVEAARYRISLIGFKKRETELLKLLKWSYEDSLNAIEEYQRRERTYEQVITAYQKRLSGVGIEPGSDIAELQEQLKRKDEEIAKLKKEIADLNEKIAALEKGVPVATIDESDLEAERERLKQIEELLNLKEQALRTKEEYFKQLLEELESE
ncbi:MAG: tetratricopeptide repeat protein [Spirochaetales bacterium]|nr:tetratricopeptide repeat protein [Spirochaetales bacterium]